MPEKQGSNDSLFKEVFKKGYFTRARIRARRRKSPWNLILIPLSMFGIGMVSYYLFRFMWWIHILVYPEHKGHFSEFWQSGISLPSFISSFLLMMPVLFAAFPLGFMIANCLAWCIPPARKTSDQEAKGYKFASFEESMRGLYKISLIWVPVCLILSLIGALTLRNLK